MQHKFDSKQLKKLLITTTIALFATSAVLGVIFILIGANRIGWKIEGSIAILALLSLLSMNNVFRLDAQIKHVKILSIVALISNIFWSLPWILIVWDVLEMLFCGQTTKSTSYGYSYTTCSGGYYAFIEGVTKMAVTAGIISVVTTIAANFLNIAKYTSTIVALRISTVCSAVVLGVYFLPAVWSEDGRYLSDSWRFSAIVGIVLVFGAIVTPVLAKSAKTKARSSAQRAIAETPHGAGQPLVSQSVDEEALRKEIEVKVRAEIAVERKREAKSSSLDQEP